jgi:predicted nucleotidyltransferase
MEAITVHPVLSRLIARAKSDPDILAVVLYGSRARGDDFAESDFDVCLVLQPESGSAPDASHKRLEYLSKFSLDITIFQQLPLYIRSRILREGSILFVRDEDALYAIATRTARAFEHFKPIYREYLEHVSRD